MKAFLEHYFYVFYCIIRKTGSGASSYINTYIGIAALATFNSMSLVPYLGIKITEPNIWLAVLLFFTILSYFLFVYKGKYLTIYQEYSIKLSEEKLKKLIIVVIGYKVLSLAFLLYTVVKLRNGIDLEFYFLK